MKTAILTMVVIVLSGCGSLASDRVEGDRMVTIVETGADAQASYPIFFGSKGVVGSCRVETSESALDGVLRVHYRGQQCSVEYSR